MTRLAALVACVVVSWVALWCYTPRVSSADEPPAEQPAVAPAEEDPFADPAQPAHAADTVADNPFDAAPARKGPAPRADGNVPFAAQVAEKSDPMPRLEARIRAALLGATKMDFHETPLQDMIDYLKDLHGIEIQIDTKALEDAAIGTDTPVSMSVNGISLGSALRLLRAMGLTYVVRDGVLLITSTGTADRMYELRVYDVGELVDAGGDVRELVAALEPLFTGASSSEHGACGRSRAPAAHPGNGAESAQPRFDVVPYRNLLIVQASQHNQEELTRLLGEIKAKLKTGE